MFYHKVSTIIIIFSFDFASPHTGTSGGGGGKGGGSGGAAGGGAEAGAGLGSGGKHLDAAYVKNLGSGGQIGSRTYERGKNRNKYCKD